MNESQDSLPIAIICDQCGVKFFADLRQSNNPDDTPCPKCGPRRRVRVEIDEFDEARRLNDQIPG